MISTMTSQLNQLQGDQEAAAGRFVQVGEGVEGQDGGVSQAGDGAGEADQELACKGLTSLWSSKIFQYNKHWTIFHEKR